MRLVVGRIGRPHGVRGECTIEVRSDFPDERFVPGNTFDTDPVEKGPLRITRAQWQGSRLCVAFEGVSTRNDAQNLRSVLLTLDSTHLRELSDEDEFYDHELHGMRVQLLDGRVLGSVARVIHAPASELLVLKRENGVEELIPFIHQFVPEIDRVQRIITLDPPEGLVEL